MKVFVDKNLFRYFLNSFETFREFYLKRNSICSLIKIKWMFYILTSLFFCIFIRIHSETYQRFFDEMPRFY